MKKIFMKIWITLLILIFIGVIALFIYINSLKEAKQESIQYNQEKVVKMIDSQLKGIDIEKIRVKAKLIEEKSVRNLQELVNKGDLTYEELTAYYLDKIKTIDQTEEGTNSVAEINPHAIEEARNFDKNKNSSKSFLYGIPITLKDNINAKNMPMSAGTYILKDYMPKEDAQIVEKLKNQGALILGKVNLSELANFTSPKTPSGYSSKVGQTKNPFEPLKISPLGSSSGSAVSITENIGVISIGTETSGSIIAPSAINSVVGMKPSRKNISGEGIFPLSSSLDVAGPIAKNVEDIAIAYNAMANDSSSKIDIESLRKDELKGKTIGIFKNNNELYDKLKEKFKNLNVNLVEVEVNSNEIDIETIINNDFKFDVEKFSKKYKLPFNTLSDLIKFNNEDKMRRAKYGQKYLEIANESKARDKEFNNSQIEKAKNILNNLISKNKLDAIVFFNNDEVILPAVAGYPEITVPFGKNNKGEAQGVTFISKENADIDLIKIAYSFEQETNLRQKINK